MLDTQEFGDYLQSVGLRDFVGVPCSYLAPLINYAIKSKRFIMSNNEGDAVAIASGISLCRLIHNNSSLGSHLKDCASLEAVITHKVTPAPKFTQNLQSNTALVRSTRKALSGWGIFKGEGATSQFKPFLLKEKNKKSKNQNISNKDTSLTAQYDKVIESKTNPSNLDSKKGAWFIYLKIQKGSKDNLGRPKVTPQEVAQRLSEYMRGNSDEF